MTDVNAGIDSATIESRVNHVAAVASLSPAMAVMVNDRRQGRRRYILTRHTPHETRNNGAAKPCRQTVRQNCSMRSRPVLIVSRSVA